MVTIMLEPTGFFAVVTREAGTRKSLVLRERIFAIQVTVTPLNALDHACNMMPPALFTLLTSMEVTG